MGFNEEAHVCMAGTNEGPRVMGVYIDITPVQNLEIDSSTAVLGVPIDIE